MTKNYYFIFLLSLLTTMAVDARVALMPPPEVQLEVSKIDPTIMDDDQHKGPVQIPEVSLDDHTLYFFTPCDGYTLNLMDENDVVVYTIVIPTGTTSWVLPATLSGEYELQLINGNYCFWGMITL